MSSSATRPFLAWPGWTHMRLAAGLTMLIASWFAAVYAGADRLTAHRALRVRVHFDAELSLPLVPAFTLVYMSIYALFLAAPFVLRTKRELTALATALSWAILGAGIGFLLVPAALAYPPPEISTLGVWQGLFQLADQINLDYNLAPSLHVALSLICLEQFAVHTGPRGTWALRAWGFLIAVSTLLTHQHHVVDVISGYALAWGVMKGRSKNAE